MAYTTLLDAQVKPCSILYVFLGSFDVVCADCDVSSLATWVWAGFCAFPLWWVGGREGLEGGRVLWTRASLMLLSLL